jgi:nitroreductase
MEFFEVLKARRSIRAYDSQPVEPEKLQQILEGINRAPSAGNLQAFEVYLVSDEERKSALARAAAGQAFLMQAPVNLVFCAHAELASGKYGNRGEHLYCIQDAAIACTFAMLSATALGLSTVWVGAFNEQAVRSVIKAPEAHRPVSILPIGYASETPLRSTRRDLHDLIHPVA